MVYSMLCSNDKTCFFIKNNPNWDYFPFIIYWNLTKHILNEAIILFLIV